MGTFLLGAVAFIVLIAVVVGVHEFGHFATAKAAGIRVDEFALGFGPRVASRTRGETVYSVRALPLGGFVKMPGMSALEEDDGGPRGFMRAPRWRQLTVLLAGVVMNFLLAGLLFGIVKTESHDSLVVAHLPTALAGLHAGDQITAVSGTPVDPTDTAAIAIALHDATDQGQGAPVTIGYRRAADGAVLTTTITPALVVVNEDDSQRFTRADGQVTNEFVVDQVGGSPVRAGDAATALGSGATVQIVGHDYGADPADLSARVTGTLSGAQDGRGALGRLEVARYIGYAPGAPGEALPRALADGFISIPSVIGGNVKSIWDVVTTPNSGGVKNFQGPVGIAHDATSAAQSGIYSYLGLMGLISLSLGIVNVLPIPPFDGGRVVLVLAKVFRREGVGARTEMAIATAGALLIGALAILITINDIKGF